MVMKMPKKIQSNSYWHCDICNKAYVLEIELPDLKDDPFVYFGGIHMHAFTEKVDLPSIPVRICFNDRLRIAEHADDVGAILKEDF